MELGGANTFMSGTPGRRPALLGAVAFAIVSWALAAAYVAARDGFGSGDLPGFAFWSFLLSLPVYAVLRFFDRRSTSWRPAVTYLAAAAFGTLTGLAATLLVALILGGWIGAFSFPVFLCWLAGSLVAFVVVALLQHPPSWYFAIPAVALPFIAVVASLHFGLAQPADLLIHVKAGASRQEIVTIWTDVLGTPHPSGRGHSHLGGVRAVSRLDSDTEVRIRVAFRPGTSDERRAEVVRRVLASSLVARTSDLEPSSSGKVHATMVLHWEPE